MTNKNNAHDIFVFGMMATIDLRAIYLHEMTKPHNEKQLNVVRGLAAVPSHLGAVAEDIIYASAHTMIDFAHKALKDAVAEKRIKAYDWLDVTTLAGITAFGNVTDAGLAGVDKAMTEAFAGSINAMRAKRDNPDKA